MQGVLAKPVICAPVVYNPRLNSRFAAHSVIATNLTFPLKPTFQRRKLNTAARALPVSSLQSPLLMNKTENNNLVYNISLPEKRSSHVRRVLSKKSPEMTEKPTWWLRSLAGLPYLLPFLEQQSWILAHPSNPPLFLETFDNLTFPLLSTIFALPSFVRAIYPVVLYFFIVRRKAWPHFLRFHVMMGILLGVLVQAIGVSSNWIPPRSYPPHFWSLATFLFLVTIFECLRCAFFGTYSAFPFVKDAALVHSDLNIL